MKKRILWIGLMTDPLKAPKCDFQNQFSILISLNLSENSFLWRMIGEQFFFDNLWHPKFFERLLELCRIFLSLALCLKKRIIWVCWFLAKSLTNFNPTLKKLHSRTKTLFLLQNKGQNLQLNRLTKGIVYPIFILMHQKALSVVQYNVHLDWFELFI